MSNEKREQQIRSKAKELGQKYFSDEANIWARGNIEAEYVESACVEMAEWLDQHPQWIPVEEELPKFDEQVLVYGLCPNGCRLFYVDCLIQDINDNGYPKWDDDTIIPTHWMPIVPPRKEANDE